LRQCLTLDCLFVFSPKATMVQQSVASRGQSISAMIDEEKLKDALHFLHSVFTLLARNKHYKLMLASNSSVLDFEMRTAIWACEVAKMIQAFGGNVIGFGSSNLLPPSDLFDLIHTRVLPYDKRDWSAFYKNAYEYLKPGGWLEQEALNLTVLYSDAVKPPNSYLETLARERHKTAENDERYLEFEITEALLKNAGFTNIEKDTIKLPTHLWEESDHERRHLGCAFNIVLQFLLKTGEYALPGLGLRPLDLNEILTKIHKSGSRASCTLVVWTAEKPWRDV
ncbi:methyltransferase domain-containing protein, partial [Colletotrichum incanum]